MKPLSTFIKLAFVCAVTASPMALSPAARAEAAPDNNTWEGSAAFGLTITRGNSRTTMADLTVKASDKWDNKELLLSGSLTYGTSEGEKTAESADGTAQFNLLFTERTYGGLKLNLFHDTIAEIRYRATIAPLAGHYFIKNPTANLSGEVGPAFVYTSKGSGTNESTSGYFTARLGERFEYKFSETAKMWQTLEFLPQVDNLNVYLVNFEIGAEAALNSRMSLRVVLQDFYNSDPAGDGPDRRKHNDIRLIAGVAYKF